MALMKSSEVPTDAVSLSEMEATSYVWDLVNDWDTFSDTWALRYGPAFLGGINALSGILINRFYRQKLKLGTYGYFSSVVPISVMPAMLTALFHRHAVSTGMLLMKDVCPICYEMRSAMIQLGIGIAYPMVLGPAAALMMSHRYATFRIPDLREPIVMFKFLAKITRPFKGTIAGLAVTQIIASSVVTYFEMKNHLSIRKKIMAIENKLMKERGLDS